MSNYPKIKREAERIKRDFPLLDYFHKLVGSGHLKYEGIQGKEYFFGFPDQRTGSISVDDGTNLWYDHSAGRGGDIIQAVQIFENKTFFQAVQEFSGSSPIESTISRKISENTHKIEVMRTLVISHDALVSYVHERGLEVQEISGFAKEIQWRNVDKRYFAVGFPNESGGWVLRSSVYKGNILGGGISIQILGSPKRTKIFEGWFDFLSYLKLAKATDFKAIILNSTANLNLRLILDILNECETVDLYLDNDATGEEYTKDFMRIAQLFRYCIHQGISTDWDLEKLKGSRDKVVQLLSDLKIRDSMNIWEIQTDISDQRSHYIGFEDVNEFLVSRSKKG